MPFPPFFFVCFDSGMGRPTGGQTSSNSAFAHQFWKKEPSELLFVAKCVDRVEERRFADGIVAEEDTNEPGEGKGENDGTCAKHGGPLRDPGNDD